MSTRCSTPVFSTCAFSRLPCSLQSPSRQWRAVNVAAAVCSASASSLLGDFPFTIAGWSGDECSRCRGAALSRSVKLCCNCCCRLCWGIFPRPWIGDWVSRNKKMDCEKLTRRPFCWWFIQRSAKPSLMVSGIKLAGDHCCLSWWSAAFFWLS